MVDLCLSQVNPGFDLFDFQTFKVHPVSLKIHQRVHALADIIHFRLNKVQLYIQKHAILWSHIPENFPFFNRIKGDRKSTRLNSSHVAISYAVFCLKKKNKHDTKSIQHMKKKHNTDL